MKVVAKNFENDKAALIGLLKSSVTKEVILYDEVKCNINIEPSYSIPDIEELEKQDLRCYITSTSESNVTLTQGFFNSKKNNYKIINKAYEIFVGLDEDNSKTISMKIQSTNLENIAHFSDPERNHCILL